jgi:hypothetical protein
MKGREEGKGSRKELQSLKNLPLRKGIEGDIKSGLMKVTVERTSKNDISAGGLVEYMLKIEQNRYIPAF